MNKETLSFKTNNFLVIIIICLVLTIILFSYFLKKTESEISDIREKKLILLRESSLFAENAHSLYFLVNNFSPDNIDLKENIQKKLQDLEKNFNFYSNQISDKTGKTTLNKNISDLKNSISSYLEFYNPVKDLEALESYKTIESKNIPEIQKELELLSPRVSDYILAQLNICLNSLKLYLFYDTEALNNYNDSYNKIISYLTDNKLNDMTNLYLALDEFNGEANNLFNTFDISKRIQAKNYLLEINGLLNTDYSSIITKSSSQVNLISENFNNLLKMQKISYVVFLSCLFIVLILTLFHIYYVNMKLVKNLEHLKLKIGDINSGKSSISNHIIIDSHDELSEIANGFNEFEDRLHNLIVRIKSGAFSIQQSVEILNTYNDSLVKKSESQHSKIETINSSLADVKKTINFNNENTLKLNKLTKKTKKITEIISLEAKNLSDTINTIFIGSEEIENISTSIEELSFQTTILSLNSAVESTRMQTGVKSFDVISNEIHKLSTMGKQAAKEIKNLSSENRIKIDESSFYLKNTVRLIETIVTKINEISFLLDDITQGSRQETEGISNILNSLADIELSTHHTNAIAKDTLSLSEQLNNEALVFLEMIAYFDKTINFDENKKNTDENLDIVLSDEEKEKIMMSFDNNKKSMSSEKLQEEFNLNFEEEFDNVSFEDKEYEDTSEEKKNS